ncbi:3-keto-disaccharide hydrolase [Flavisolibacter ginsenosidimutans]|uniref:DUF1080 domain-containing protein n=1 Tax=Flavisolibacter ginsenosidimutans TaxID=661481 RepID=A0A5B8UFV8_9BACT|nr:DUF1080 domain-containing protein [Flavisolibacter ginsenosidimutans]QEC55474.1 DUF1080 domain-containing protein [Flavisolibacter ginsenosidimutans]
MKTIALFIAAGAALSLTAYTTKTSMQATNMQATQDGWTNLFDGKTTKGWHTYNKKEAGKAWQIENGALHLDTLAKKQNSGSGGDLVTDEEFDNFDLKLEWKISPKGNSGVIFFIHEDPKIGESYETGMEMQVLDNGTPTRLGHPDGKLYTHRAGDLYDLLAAKEVAKPQGEWNAAEIVAKNGKLDFYLNGQHTLSTTMWDENWRQMIAISKFKQWLGFGTFKKGRIGLQDHGNEVWYRNIKIKKL